jgi:fluoroacetyl-CoA thioesterase
MWMFDARRRFHVEASGGQLARYHNGMKEIPTGTAGEYRLLVTAESAIDFLGSPEARMLSTPHLIGYMEMAARNSLLPYLDEGWDSVGTMVNIRHLSATPEGMSVRITSKVLGVDGQRVMFTVEAWDETEKIGEGTHERFVIHIPRFVSRLAGKRETRLETR